VNKSAEAISGYKLSELAGKHFAPLVHANDLAMAQDRFFRTVQGEPQSLEVRVYAKNGNLFILSVNITPLYENGKIVGVVGFGRDITEHKKAEEALLESETKYRIVADNTYDWEWWRDPEGNFIYVSPSCKGVTHHEAGEFITDPDLLLRIIHPDDKSSFIRHQIEVEQKHSPGEIEFRILRPDGSLRWIAHGCQPVFDEQGHFLGRRGSNRDVTEHKWAEEALRESEKQLRHLSSQLLTAQETERRRISKELHDELGQALTVMKFRLSFAEKQLTKDQVKVREECEAISQYIDQVIENVRRLSRDLTPSILEDVGLSAAIRWLIGNFNKNDSINITLDIMDIDHLFSENAQIIIYRVIQEAFTNIGKHAHAKNVSVVIRKQGDGVSFSVEDDGIGFDVSKIATVNPAERGLGLAIMDERVWILGGSLEMWSQEGKGTRISFHIPLKKEGNL
jgi:PAS domain S-box-containing protein